MFDEDFRHSNPTLQPEYKALAPELELIYSTIRAHFDADETARDLQIKNGDGYPIRTLLTRLSPGGEIMSHMDRNFSLTHCHRVHIPIQTHPDAVFTVGDETIHLPEGEAWEINNRRMHSVLNASPLPRIHLIIDWVIPGEPCCCAQSRHPETSCSPAACELTDWATEPCNCLQ